jgi:hypothetical protein
VPAGGHQTGGDKRLIKAVDVIAQVKVRGVRLAEIVRRCYLFELGRRAAPCNGSQRRNRPFQFVGRTSKRLAILATDCLFDGSERRRVVRSKQSHDFLQQATVTSHMRKGRPFVEDSFGCRVVAWC